MAGRARSSASLYRSGPDLSKDILHHARPTTWAPPDFIRLANAGVTAIPMIPAGIMGGRRTPKSPGETAQITSTGERSRATEFNHGEAGVFRGHNHGHNHGRNHGQSTITGNDGQTSRAQSRAAATTGANVDQSVKM
eukprot:gene24407-biopygen19416